MDCKFSYIYQEPMYYSEYVIMVTSKTHLMRLTQLEMPKL